MKALVVGGLVGAVVLLLSQLIPVMRMTNLACGVWGFAGGAAAAWVWSRQTGRRSVAMGALAGLVAGLVSGGIELATGTVAMLFAPGLIVELPAVRASLEAVPRERPLTPEAVLTRFEASVAPGTWVGTTLHRVTRGLRGSLVGAGARERARWQVALDTFAGWVDAAERRDLRPLLRPWLAVGALLALLGCVIPMAGGALAGIFLPPPPAPSATVTEGAP